MRKGKNIADVLSSTILFLIGSFAVFHAVDLQLGSPTEPGPGFFPFITGFLLAVMAIILFIQAQLGNSSGSRPFAKIWKKPAIAFSGSILYLFIIDKAGFLISTTLLALTILRILDAKKWWVDLIVSLFISFSGYILFAHLLDVPLPKGMLISFF